MEESKQKSESNIDKKIENCKMDIFVSSATTLSFIFQSAFLYGYIFFLYKESRQYKIYLGFHDFASYGLCPVLPILEVYLHGVAMTSVFAFITIFIMYTTSLSPPAIANNEVHEKLQDDKNLNKEEIFHQSDFNKPKYDEHSLIMHKTVSKGNIQGTLFLHIYCQILHFITH